MAIAKVDSSEEEKMEVYLFVYDLSKGSVSWANFLLFMSGIEAIYHTGLVINGKLIEYGRGGVTVRDKDDEAVKPKRILQLGKTKKTWTMVEKFIEDLKGKEYTKENYHVVKNNCISFSNELSKFLLNKEVPMWLKYHVLKVLRGIPEYVTKLATVIQAFGLTASASSQSYVTSKKVM